MTPEAVLAGGRERQHCIIVTTDPDCLSSFPPQPPAPALTRATVLAERVVRQYSVQTVQSCTADPCKNVADDVNQQRGLARAAAAQLSEGLREY